VRNWSGHCGHPSALLSPTKPSVNICPTQASNDTQESTGNWAQFLLSGSCCLAFPMYFLVFFPFSSLFQLPIISVTRCMLNWKVWSWKVIIYDSFPASAYLNRAPYGVLPLCTIFLTTTPCANTRLLNDLISCFWLKQLLTLWGNRKHLAGRTAGDSAAWF
jgi:hypothetical protein